MTKAPSVVFAGGGTAGHINPMLAIARALRELEPNVRILTLGTADKMEAELVPAAGFEIEFIPRAPMPRSLSKDTLSFPAKLVGGIKRVATLLREREADVAVGVGGYVCSPLYLAAAQAKVPIVIHEANARPGWANKLGGRFSAFSGVAFANTPFKGAQLVGMPMKEEIAHLDRAAQRREARLRLGLDPDKPTLIVTGGSLGAASLNKAVAENIESFAQANFQVLHITGKTKAILDDAGKPVVAPNYIQIEFSNGMQDVYAAADLLMVRSGAATVSEIAAVGLPAVFVPLPHGNGEQGLNAATLVEAEAALLVEDSQVTGEWFAQTIPALMNDPQRLEAMAARAYELGIRDAAQVMAAKILELAREHRAARDAQEAARDSQTTTDRKNS
ncbi:MAG: undecaprenyldiphospho-muramoylpentapeptide beta-N-acetylglucosaminyltransferase [Rothia sp. (in: high G+C Gram-positive bacteria)]|uniref:undecaprenyldiphospho-muramoylpentapeptide beta-N-acetylglucosaminyltransferase n=1 Tax=Rothia sp. (in: high G+C Gram-positive bacteria) TaxID=1885016 RepID=UPI0026DEFE81|nr:undecaprenyldiphospho-muramoylpentapeptide beta-N-acetylglucosaminyltransferase [Rothia sp. (in: high G+C Gram-positive bacteria)]MDO5751098.1 undecaprenyldiphospho-muramoylpentapeptide beta-N-acetylglucosaminyltransferase [Rothia sp. (in: high G+C Gram-positive bacteria)]